MRRALALLVVLAAVPAHATHFAGGGLQCAWSLLVGASGAGCCDTLKAEYTFTDSQMRAMIDITTAAQAQALRRRAIAYIWKQELLPTDTPTVTTNVADPFDWTPPATVNRIDEWATPMPDGFTSRMYLFRPSPMRSRLYIIHQGHTSSMLVGNVEQMATELLARGYAVLVANMPGYGANTAPFDPTSGGQLHNPMSTYETGSQSSIYFFLHPVLEAVNYAYANGWKSVYMTGLSGGGWSTTLYSALDPRIHRSIEVAGSYPFWFWDSPCFVSTIEHEQGWGPLYAVLGDPLNQYILGAFDSPWRRRMQLHNKWDDCCFYGVSGQQYDPVVEDIVGDIGAGGRIDYVLDASDDRHQFPPAAMSTLLAWFGE